MHIMLLQKLVITKVYKRSGNYTYWTFLISFIISYIVLNLHVKHILHILFKYSIIEKTNNKYNINKKVTYFIDI